jgi:hypothetical protein
MGRIGGDHQNPFVLPTRSSQIEGRCSGHGRLPHAALSAKKEQPEISVFDEFGDLTAQLSFLPRP